MAKKNNSIKDAITHAEASALLAMTYTIGFIVAVMYMLISGIAYSTLGVLPIDLGLYEKIFDGLLAGELTVLGYYVITRNNKKE